MASLNYRDSYAFDPEAYSAPGGLLGMLHRALQEQQRAGYTGQPDASTVDNAGTAPGGLLANMLALQADRQQSRPLGEVRGPIPPAPRDPNFRQLVRASSTGDAALPSAQSPKGFDNSAGPAPIMAGFGQLARKVGPRPIPPGPGTIPEIPLPHISETWRNAWSLFPLMPELARSLAMGEGFASNPDRDQHAGPAIGPDAAGIPASTLPDWPDIAAKIPQVLPRGMYGSGSAGDSARGRCLQASEGNTDDWENFCKFLDRRQNNTLGGESQNRACWSKTFESEENKKQWCELQFGRKR
jgi:hypothetical protein